VTNSAGVAQFTVFEGNTETVTFTATDTTDNVVLSQKATVNFQASGRSQFGGSFSEEELSRVVSADNSTVIAASSVIGLENKVIIVVTLNTADGLPVPEPVPES
jgi:hypothetical protein